ncbi:MAG: hypothetical protein IRY99_26710, partial [Isosphaeraceae bacterium]|nr:hypothetical protein [Isosphaeraceae bacterium]
MSGFLALVRKQLAESRWMLVLSVAALFWFSWLSVYFTALGQVRFRRLAGPGGMETRARMLRA